MGGPQTCDANLTPPTPERWGCNSDEAPRQRAAGVIGWWTNRNYDTSNAQEYRWLRNTPSARG